MQRSWQIPALGKSGGHVPSTALTPLVFNFFSGWELGSCLACHICHRAPAPPSVPATDKLHLAGQQGMARQGPTCCPHRAFRSRLQLRALSWSEACCCRHLRKEAAGGRPFPLYPSLPFKIKKKKKPLHVLNMVKWCYFQYSFALKC